MIIIRVVVLKEHWSKECHRSKLCFAKYSVQQITYSYLKLIEVSRKYNVLLFSIFQRLEEGSAVTKAVVDVLDNKGVPTVYIRISRGHPAFRDQYFAILLHYHTRHKRFDRLYSIAKII